MLYRKKSALLLTMLVSFALVYLFSSKKEQPIYAQSSGCNLVPNAAFEDLSGSSNPRLAFNSWFLANGGSGAVMSLAVENYPGGQVQSGSYAAKVTITTPGDVYLTTMPEKTAILVQPNSQYNLSVRLFSSNGVQGRLRVTEWTSTGSLAAYKTLNAGGGTGSWETLQSSFTTTPNTQYVSIRLMPESYSTVGTLIWDDPRLWKTEANKHCVDLRHYMTQVTPGFRMCQSFGNPRFCTDGWKDSYKEFVRNTSLFADSGTGAYIEGQMDWLSHSGTSATRIGIQKDYDLLEGWRCFANPGTTCGAPSSGANAHYGPQTLDIEMSLPIINNPNHTTSVTSGAYLVHGWQKLDIRRLNPNNASQPQLLGSIWHRQWAFVAPSINFGGTLGVQYNVLVIEHEGMDGNYNPIALGLNAGVRLERYWFVPGYGKVRQAGAEDSDCRSAIIAGNPVNNTICNGVFDNTGNGGLILNTQKPGDFNTPSIAPYNVVDWWID